MESAQTLDEDSMDSAFQTPSTSLSSLDTESDDSSTTSIDTVLLNFIIDLIRNDAINRLRMTPDMVQKLELIEKIASKYGIRRDSIAVGEGNALDYLENYASSEEQVDTIIERNYSSMQNLRAHILHEEELAEPSESVSFIADSDDVSAIDFNVEVDHEKTTNNTPLHNEATPTSTKPIHLPTFSDSISIVTQTESPSPILLPPSPPHFPANPPSDEVISQASTSDSAVISDPLCEFASNPETIARFTRLIGHEDVFPAVFDSNNRGVDFYFLPVYYTPQLCGFAPDSALKIAPNSVIADRYLILRELGQATFSITVECIDMRAAGNEHLCLKIIKKRDYFFDQSLDEIRVLRYLNNLPHSEAAHLLRLHDYFYNKQHLFIVTELLQNNLYEFSCLARSFPRKYFTLPRVRRILQQVLEALQFIHAHNVVHCDLKPENILLCDIPAAQVKLVDFGGANFIRSIRDVGTHPYIQSRSYRAPEIILKMAFDERIDLWSLGCIAAELVTGELLFDNSSVAALLTSASAILGPIPAYLLRVAGLEGIRQGGRTFVKMEKGLWELEPPRRDLRSVLQTEDWDFVDFVWGLLQWDPMERMTASQALKHPFIARERECERFEWEGV